MESRRIRERYRLLEPIGGGAMGTVWRAQDERLDRTVAIKELVVPDEHDEGRMEEAKNRAMREARIAARLQHSHAITVFAVLEEEDRPWLIMEYLPSKSFAVLVREEPTTVDDAIRVGAQISSALAMAHRAGIVHRDVKPANILVSEDGTAKITDFGISRAIGDVRLTATGEIAGTPAFLAPEVARGEEATFAADVFSLGATLYAAVEGEPPYGTADNPIALLYKASSGEIEPPRKAGRLTPLLLRMLAREPGERPSMEEVHRELTALLPEPALPPMPATLPVVPPAPEPSPELVRGSRRGLIAVGAGAVLLCVAVVVAILLVVRQRPPQHDAAPPPVVSSSSAAPSTSSSSPAPSPSTSPTVSSVASTTTAAQALTSYYGLLPANPEAAWKLLTPEFKASRHQTYASYTSFWGQFSSVRVSNVSESGSGTVTASVTYVRKSGGTETNSNSFSMVQVGGTWMINSQR